MKQRLIALLLCLMLLCSLAAAETELGSLSDEELLTLMEQVNAEAVSRKLNKTAKLSMGRYTAGRDIPAGTYLYTCTAAGSDWGSVVVERQDGSTPLWKVVSAPANGEEPDSFVFTLEDGDVLDSGTSFTLTVFTGIRFE